MKCRKMPVPLFFRNNRSEVDISEISYFQKWVRVFTWYGVKTYLGIRFGWKISVRLTFLTPFLLCSTFFIWATVVNCVPRTTTWACFNQKTSKKTRNLAKIGSFFVILLILTCSKKCSPTGNRTLVSRVTGGDTHHYTIEDYEIHAFRKGSTFAWNILKENHLLYEGYRADQYSRKPRNHEENIAV